MKNSTTMTSSTVDRVFDRRLKMDVPGIASVDEKFALENGFYVNETETVICKSNNETGKYFCKLSFSQEEI